MHSQFGGDMTKTQLVRFKPDEIVFEEGESTRDLYIIRAGTVRVSKASDEGLRENE